MTTCLGIFDPDDLEEIAKSDSELAYLARESLVTLHNVLDVHGNNEDEEPAPGHAHRTVYHGRNKVDYDCSAENLLLCDKTPLIPPSTSQEANNLFTSIEHVRNFLTQVMARNSMDNLGMEIKSKVHFGSEYLNCHWVGSLSLLVWARSWYDDRIY